MLARLRAVVLATAPPVPPRPPADAPPADRRRWLWRRAQHGWPAAYPLAQFPNAPLLLSLAASLVARLLPDGGAHDAARATSSVLLACWAWLELSAGVNLWRRALGLTFLVVVIAGVAEQLG